MREVSLLWVLIGVLCEICCSEHAGGYAISAGYETPHLPDWRGVLVKVATEG